jgi:hypothetical protein
MLFFLTTQSLWLSGLVLVGLTTILAMFGPYVVRRYIALENLVAHNEIAGFKFATIGVLYAVLLAFAIILVWQKFSEAETAVVQEAGAAATVYRVLPGLGEKPAAELRNALSKYLIAAIDDDWPEMDRGSARASTTSRQALDAAYSALLTFEFSRPNDNVLVAEILRQLDAITQARRTRLIAAAGVVPNVIWLVLFGGGVLTVSFTFFFGTENLRAQTLMTGLLSLLIFSELLAIVVIDRPFSGPVKVEPGALAYVLADFAPQARGLTVPSEQH